MNYAQFVYSDVSATSRTPCRLLIPDTMSLPDSEPKFQPHRKSGAYKFVALLHEDLDRAQAPSLALHKPVRVVRVLEAGQARNKVGRMRISGRMADVCAELDRLAARETKGIFSPLFETSNRTAQMTQTAPSA
jgi:hypothetical protein